MVTRPTIDYTVAGLYKQPIINHVTMSHMHARHTLSSCDYVCLTFTQHTHTLTNIHICTTHTHTTHACTHTYARSTHKHMYTHVRTHTHNIIYVRTSLDFNRCLYKLSCNGVGLQNTTLSTTVTMYIHLYSHVSILSMA